MITESLTNDEVFFLKCVRISDSVSGYVEKNEGIDLIMRNIYLLGCFLSNTLEMKNSKDKLSIILIVC